MIVGDMRPRAIHERRTAVADRHQTLAREIPNGTWVRHRRQRMLQQVCRERLGVTRPTI